MARTALVAAAAGLLIAAVACGSSPAVPELGSTHVRPLPTPAPAAPPTPESPEAKQVDAAKAFVVDADRELRRVMVAASVAEWTQQTDGTAEHQAAAVTANGEQSRVITQLMRRARTFEPVLAKLTPAERRQLQVLVDMLPVVAAVQPAPEDAAQAGELASVSEQMGSVYAGGKTLDDLAKVMAKSRKPDELLAAWRAWHDTIGRAEKPLFAKYVPLANAGAKAVGFANVAELWQAGYDMPPDAFAADTDRLWDQVKPLYTQLHCYARRKLNARYGDKVVPKTGPIPAHLLGNMWAQHWGWLYPELEPYPGVARIDVTPVLAAKYDPTAMVKMGEAFYTSLGMAPLPDTFWQRSMMSRPAGKQVECHASSWDVTFSDDLRIKMCIQPTQEDLVTIHHELGHSYYFQAYYQLPILLQNGANDGFHEAIGDTIALSMTPAYLKQKGLLDKVVTSDKAAINALMRVALDKVAFLPFGLLLDRWRWDVFAGKVMPDQYNAHYWELRDRYQGVSRPLPAGPDDFDPGAKYHVATNTPYMRYFLAAMLQFQFQRALCKTAGFTGPLHDCSIYGNKAAGEAFQAMLALGASEPWQDALAQLTGEREVDAGAMLEYFAPLQAWLEAQNKGQTCGW